MHDQVITYCADRPQINCVPSFFPIVRNCSKSPISSFICRLSVCAYTERRTVCTINTVRSMQTDIGTIDFHTHTLESCVVHFRCKLVLALDSAEGYWHLHSLPMRSSVCYHLVKCLSKDRFNFFFWISALVACFEKNQLIGGQKMESIHPNIPTYMYTCIQPHTHTRHTKL